MPIKLIAAVVIGRNEGQRLVTCLKSLIGKVDHIVYVDSGSSDTSIHEASILGVDTLSLDMSMPFTAARARNAGAKYLLTKYTGLNYLQFIDGDCEMQPEWIDNAYRFLEDHKNYAVVCGRRRERFPEHSIFNHWCDIEWNTAIGDALACGGDALIRRESFQQCNGYREDVIAGEEPEMCFRFRQNGWKIRRLDVEMTLHDAAITKFSQWFKRTMRSGYAFTLGYSIHGQSKERYWAKECRSIALWGVLAPGIFLLGMLFNPLFCLMLVLYPIQIIRVFSRATTLNMSGFLWASGIVLGKVPEAIGQIKCLTDKVNKKTSIIIEYK